jgi:hypothetical protein
VVDEAEGVDADAETDAVTEMPLEVGGVTDGVVIETLEIDVGFGVKSVDVGDVLPSPGPSVACSVSDEILQLKNSSK